MNSKLLLSLIFSSLLFSCKKNDSDPQSNQGLWPMNVGNEWHYTSTLYKYDGSVEFTFTEDFIINDTKRFNSVLYFGNSGTDVYYTNLTNDIVSTTTFVNTPVNDSFAVVFQRPKSSDNIIWQILYDVCDQINQQFQAVPGNFSINGYDCLKNEEIGYRSCTNTLDYSKNYYLKPGIGLVRYEEYVKYPGYDTAYLRLRRDLTSYTLVD